MAYDILLSAVTSEFAKDHAVWGQTRQKLTPYLRRAECSVCVQEDFGQSKEQTLHMLDQYVRQCSTIVHLVGEDLGFKPIYPEIRDLTDHLASEGRPIDLEDITSISYTQWEAVLAVHHGKNLYVYATEPGKTAQAPHLERLRAGSVARFATDIADREDLIGKVLADLREIFPDIPERIPNNLQASFGKKFFGRQTLFDTIRVAIQRQPVALYGLGGLGKTRFATEFGHRFAEHYGATLTVRGDTLDELRTTVADLAQPTELDLPQSEGDLEARYTAVRHWLEKEKDWFLLIDNVDTPAGAAAVEEFVAPLKNGHILITTRVAKWPESIHTENLDFLNPEDSRAFFLSRSGKRRPKTETDEANLDELVGKMNNSSRHTDAQAPMYSVHSTSVQCTLASTEGRLGGLALAIEQAGAYIDEREISFAEYLRRLDASREKIQGWNDQRLTKYPHSVLETWQTSIDQLSDDAQDLLAELSFCAAAPIPRELFVDDDDGLVELRRFSLVRFLHDPENTVFVHRLVQEIVFGGLEEEEKAEIWKRYVQRVRELMPGDGWKYENWDIWSRFAPHADRFAELEPQFANNSDCLLVLTDYGNFQSFRNAAYAKAEPILRRALKIGEDLLGPEHPDTLNSLGSLANLLNQAGKYAKAEPLYRRDLETSERVLGPEHPDTLTILNNLALLLNQTGKYAEAEPLYRRALETRERVLGPEHPDTLQSLNNLAELFRTTGKYAEAEPLYRRALEARERVLGPEHPDTLSSLNNMALLLKQTGKYTEAEPLYRRALETSERVLGPEHPSTLTSLNNLALLLDNTGKYSEAEPLYRRVLETRERVLGPEHPDTLQSLNNLGAFLVEQQQHKEALPLLKRAYSGRLKILGPEHPKTEASKSWLDRCRDELQEP